MNNEPLIREVEAFECPTNKGPMYLMHSHESEGNNHWAIILFEKIKNEAGITCNTVNLVCEIVQDESGSCVIKEIAPSFIKRFPRLSEICNKSFKCPKDAFNAVKDIVHSS